MAALSVSIGAVLGRRLRAALDAPSRCIAGPLAARPGSAVVAVEAPLETRVPIVGAFRELAVIVVGAVQRLEALDAASLLGDAVRSVGIVAVGVEGAVHAGLELVVADEVTRTVRVHYAGLDAEPDRLGAYEAFAAIVVMGARFLSRLLALAVLGIAERVGIASGDLALRRIVVFAEPALAPLIGLAVFIVDAQARWISVLIRIIVAILIGTVAGGREKRDDEKRDQASVKRHQRACSPFFHRP